MKNLSLRRWLAPYRSQPALIQRKAEVAILVTGLMAALFLLNLAAHLVLFGPSWGTLFRAVLMLGALAGGLILGAQGRLEPQVNLLAVLCLIQCLVFFPQEVSRQFFALCLFSMVAFAVLAIRPYQKVIAFLVFPVLVACKGAFEFWQAGQGQLSRDTLAETLFTLTVFGAAIPLVNTVMAIVGREIHHAEVLLDVNKHLNTMAATDRLTGVWNRRAFGHLIRRETGQALRTGRPLSVAMVDLDRFKQVNDRYGHQVGDEALLEVVKVLTESLRQEDSLIRWGGDEFVVLFPGSGPGEAPGLGEKLRKTVRQDPKLEAWNLGISVGVAVWRPGETVEALLSRADELLYQAKNRGRNQVCSESGPGTASCIDEEDS